MKKSYLVQLKTILFLIVYLIISCKHEPIVNEIENKNTITLKWNKAYTDETAEKIETGLKWVFLFLGAELESGSFKNACKWKEADLLQIEFDKLGFNNNSLIVWQKILKNIKESNAYKKEKSIDIGRFVMLTLNSSYQYYAITGAENNLENYKTGKFFDPKKAAIIESSVASNDRLITLPDSNNNEIQNFSFIAEEGVGKIADNTFTTHEIEIKQLMPNMQFRFAIYNTNGTLENSASPNYSSAGKPAKCLWCHETFIQPVYFGETSVMNYYDYQDFNRFIEKRKQILNEKRLLKNRDINYMQQQDHYLAELLYISFMEPNVERLALEWNLSLAKTALILANFETHTNSEFPELGNCYDRNEIDFLAPQTQIKTPQSAREFSVYEPYLIN